MFFKNALTWALRYRKCEKEKRILAQENEILKRQVLEMKAEKDDLVSTKVFVSRIGDALDKEGEILKHNGKH